MGSSMHGENTTATSATSLMRPTLVLMAGGLLAQLLPLLLGPWLTRLYTPTEFGVWQVLAAVAATVAVVACGRYEFALPLASSDRQAQALRSLALACLAAVVGASAVAAALWAMAIQALWPWWLPLAVLALGLLSLATLWATRAQRFSALAVSRVVQHGGGAVLQVAAGLAGWGLKGLLLAPVVAAGAALLGLKLPWRGTLMPLHPEVRQAAHAHRSFALLGAPHALLGTAVDAAALALVGATQGMAAAGLWGLALRYAKAPATLVGGALSTTLYARLAADAAAYDGQVTQQAKRDVQRAILSLLAMALLLTLVLVTLGPWAFAAAFGDDWRDAGAVAQGLALYIGWHFVASPLAVVTMAWGAQAWALKMAALGQGLLLAALAAGLAWRGLAGAAWALSLAMSLFFAVYAWRLWVWPVGLPQVGSPTVASEKAAGR
jgi:O-antigen/teichoic acid export membrane protein